MEHKPTPFFKRFVRGFVASAILLASTFSVGAAYAQQIGDADAEILSQTGLVKLDDLAFGTMIPGAAGGQVVINPANNARTTSGTVVGAAGTHHAARFRANGSPNVLALIALPALSTITNQDGPGTMTVTNYNVDGAIQILFLGLAVNLGPTGVRDLDVGATLTVGPNQEAGSYEGTFDITAIYL